MSLTLQVKLLGELSITYGDRAVTGISTVRSQALLSYLILHRHAPQSRQRLAFQLWADSTDTQARSNLRKELTYLRRHLPEADRCLLVESKTLQWSPTLPVTLDVMEFEEALHTAEKADAETGLGLLKQTLALYQGDLLPSCEDEWIVPERERLQQLYIRVLEQLIDRLQQQRDYRQALSYAQQLLRADAFNEATYCTLMRLYSQSGDRANALQIYHRCMTLLRQELGVDPSASTRRLYEQLLLEDRGGEQRQPTIPLPVALPPIAAPGPMLPLVGRAREWAMVQQWSANPTYPAEVLNLLPLGRRTHRYQQCPQNRSGHHLLKCQRQASLKPLLMFKQQDGLGDLQRWMGSSLSGRTGLGGRTGLIERTILIKPTLSIGQTIQTRTSLFRSIDHPNRF